MEEFICIVAAVGWDVMIGMVVFLHVWDWLARAREKLDASVTRRPGIDCFCILCYAKLMT